MENWGAWSGIAYAAVGSLAFLLGLFVLKAAPATARNRWLAVLLLAMGGYAVLFGLYSTQNWGFVFSDAGVRRGLYISSWVLFTLFPVVYFGLLRQTIARKRWWNGMIPLFLLLSATVVWFVLAAAIPSLWTTGRVWMFGIYVGGAISIFGFLVALQWVFLSLWMRKERSIAFAFLIAFTIRNLQFIRDLLRALSEDVRGEAITFGPAVWYTEWNFDLWQDVFLEGLFLALLAFAVLSGQLVSLDRRIKASIRTGAVTLVLSMVFILLTEGIETLLNIDSILLSIGAAMVVALVAQPIQNGAEFIATRLVPGASLIDTLPTAEKKETYLFQAAIAWEDGVLRPKEETMLKRLQAHLGLSDDVVARLDVKAQADGEKIRRKLQK